MADTAQTARELPPDETQIRIGDLLGRFGRVWRMWLGGAIVGGILGVALSFAMTPVYRSSVVVTVETMDPGPFGGSSLAGQLGGLAGLAGLSLGETDRRQEAIAILQSRELADRFIEESQMMLLFFRDQWDPATKTWRKPRWGNPPTRQDAFRFFDQRVRSVSEDRRSGLVTVAMEWRDPKLAADWANQFVAKANLLLRQRAMADARLSLGFLERELEKSPQVELRQSVYQLIEAQKKQEMLASVREEYAFRIIDHAHPSDPDKFERPKRQLIGGAGALFGLALGLLFGLWREDRKAGALRTS